MTLALLGEKLTHSLSPVIHKMVFEKLNADGSYELCEISPDNLDVFMKELKNGKYDGINITIPYKTDVIKYLDIISKEAKDIGAVNTIKFIDNKLYGYNTDYFGFGEMLKHSFIEVKTSGFAVLGAGGAAKGVVAYLSDNKAKSVEVFTRDYLKAKENFKSLSGNCNFKIRTYDSLILKNKILINSTPLGMYPNIDKSPISQNILDGCLGVVDLIYNPAKTQLMADAEKKGIYNINGFYMLVSQALKAQEIWQNKSINENLTKHIFNELKPGGKGNLILIGMPGCGKSTIGKEVSNKLGMELFDMDKHIEQNVGPIACLFNKGEYVFRDYESEAAKTAGQKTNTVICTGGGVIMRKENMETLAKSGTIVFVDRPIDILINDIDHSTRPLLDGKNESVLKLYDERIELYNKYSHFHIVNDKDLKSCENSLIKMWKGI